MNARTVVNKLDSFGTAAAGNATSTGFLGSPSPSFGSSKRNRRTRSFRPCSSASASSFSSASSGLRRKFPTKNNALGKRRAVNLRREESFHAANMVLNGVDIFLINARKVYAHKLSDSLWGERGRHADALIAIGKDFDICVGGLCLHAQYFRRDVAGLFLWLVSRVHRLVLIQFQAFSLGFQLRAFGIQARTLGHQLQALCLISRFVCELRALIGRERFWFLRPLLLCAAHKDCTRWRAACDRPARRAGTPNDDRGSSISVNAWSP
eukprot:IDg6794t1